MSKGRKKMPTSLQVLRGNPGRRPLNKKEPQPKAAIPPCPKWLGDDARRVWKEIAPLLFDMGVLSLADKVGLEMLCAAYGQWREAMAHSALHGATYETWTEHGAKVYKSYPEVGIGNDAWRRLKSMLSEFGLTPASRSKLETGKDDTSVDPLEDLLRRRSS